MYNLNFNHEETYKPKLRGSPGNNSSALQKCQDHESPRQNEELSQIKNGDVTTKCNV